MTTERQSKRKRMVSESLGVSANLNDSIQKENSIILQLQFTPTYPTFLSVVKNRLKNILNVFESVNWIVLLVLGMMSKGHVTISSIVS